VSQSRTIQIEQPFLSFPVQNGAPKRLVRLTAGRDLLREFDLELAPGEPDFRVFTDMRPFAGQTMTLTIEGDDVPTGALDAMRQTDGIVDSGDLYHERYRPQFHFSSRRGWNNDPNGLLYYQGEYHLFYQHNPYGWKWGNMHWGHAVSRDLVHWQELGEALYPDALGTMYSGSGVVDHHNATGFQTGDEPPLVLIYTAAGGRAAQSRGQPFTQCLAYSNDRGRTWTKYARNPVLGHVAGNNRDPKVIWHAPTARWVMALYLDQNDYALFTSPNLKDWMRTGDVRLPGCTECPDLFELPVDGDPSRRKWVFWAGNGGYLVGSFDGATFTPESDVLRAYAGRHSYAAQTWSGLPETDGRRLQIGWFRIDAPGMPFNQCMTFPCELTLRTTADGIRLHTQPAQEIAALHRRRHAWHDVPLDPGADPLAGIEGDLFDVNADLQVGTAVTLGLTVRGTPVVYDAATQTLSCRDTAAPLPPVDGRIRLRLLVDRTSIEIFGNGGRLAMPIAALPQGGTKPAGSPPPLALFATGGRARIVSLVFHELASIWE
jgi:sucrose-6-phosphate hydrolase SacC (GH32 family)